MENIKEWISMVGKSLRKFAGADISLVVGQYCMVSGLNSPSLKDKEQTLRRGINYHWEVQAG